MAEPMWSRAVALARKGNPPAEIAEVLGIGADAASHMLSYARKKGIEVPNFRGGGRPVAEHRAIHVRREALEALAPIATGMGMNTAKLAADLLATIARDNLVDAVLDLGGDDD